MIKSMTGYGKGECELYGRKLIVEMKSVNHRYNDISVKIPRVMGNFEEMVRKAVSQAVSRGKIDVYVSYETLGDAEFKISFNEAAADAYVSTLKSIKFRYGLDENISLSLIARFPDVINVDKSMDDEQINNEIGETLGLALEVAIKNLTKMRELEGAALKSDIIEKLELISSQVEKIVLRAPFVVQNYKDRLSQKLADALKDFEIDENRLITEITIFADKACIDEEITRLASHISQMGKILTQNDSVGRKLDFLVQEMNREVNTIGSKAGDLEITQVVVDIKSEIEKIREQVQNIE